MFCIFDKMCHYIFMEEKIIIWLQSMSNGFYDLFFQSISYLVSWVGAIFVFLAILIFIDKKYALVMGLGYVCSVCINFLLKVIIARPRPYIANPNIVNKLTTVGHSFPSGHSVSVIFIVLAIIFLMIILHRKNKFKLYDKLWFRILLYLIAVLLVIFTMIARMYLGQHYLSDILVGLSLGTVCFFATYFVYKKIAMKNKKC